MKKFKKTLLDLLPWLAGTAMLSFAAGFASGAEIARCAQTAEAEDACESLYANYDGDYDAPLRVSVSDWQEF